MASPTTRQELIDYCLRKLGAPVLEINVDDDQIEDRVDEAIQMFQEFHDDGLKKGFFKYQLLQADIDSQTIPVQSNGLMNVRKVLPSQYGTGKGMFSIEYQMFFTDALDLRNMGGLSNYVQTKQYLNLISMTLGDVRGFEFSRYGSVIIPRGDWLSKMEVGDWVVLEAEFFLDPEQAPLVYNDMWLKKYTTALIKRQWGMNLIKFEGMLLPGGVQLNGRQLFDDATAEIDELEQQLRETYELPVDFITG